MPYQVRLKLFPIVAVLAVAIVPVIVLMPGVSVMIALWMVQEFPVWLIGLT